MERLIELKETSSKILKEHILSQLTELEKKVFIYALEPTMIYHQRFSDDDIDLDNLGEPLPAMFTLLDEIAAGNTSGYSARMSIINFAEEFGDLIKLICNKELRCGVSVTTLNKVHAGLASDFKVQLAMEVPLEKVMFPCLGQIKYDGVRLITVSKNKQIYFFTRNGKLVNLPVLKEILEACDYTDWVLDGEIVLREGHQEGRTKVSGLINSAMHGGSIDESELQYFIFDGMPLEDWAKRKHNRSYHERLKYVGLFLDLFRSLTYLNEAPTVELRSSSEAEDLFMGAINLGYEGLILKHLSHRYTFKRSRDWVKMKDTKVTDLYCRLIEPGEGKYFGLIGALLCQGLVEGKEISVSVGSGLSDTDRNRPYTDFLNHLIEVKYNSVIQDSKTGKWSLFLPRFSKVHYDR